MATMRQAASKVRKHVLVNKGIDVETGEYACGIWGKLTKQEAGLHHRAVADIYRMVGGSCRMSPEAVEAIGVAIKSDIEVFRDIGVMGPAHLCAGSWHRQS